MGMILKLLAVLLVVGGVWVWVSGRSVTRDVVNRVDATQLSAGAILAPLPERPFDQEGTIVIDMTQGQGGTPYILYTEYNELGKPAVRTKRLVFSSQAACAEANLPCATNQPGAPVYPDQRVRVIGTVEDEQVEVSALYVLD